LRNIKQHIFYAILLILLSGSWASKANATSDLKKVKYKYLISVPEGYEKESGKEWPVIFYLHGRHASGTNLKSLERYGLPYFLKNGKKLDFIVVSPQCPWSKNWASEDWFNPIYDEVASKYSVDESRIYMIGISMGGFGTWALANRMPDRFAAIAPMCGGADVRWADNLSKIPTWIFHGTADRQIPISRSEVMVKALEKKNANLKFSRLKNQGHDISRQFNNDELYVWLSQFSTKKIPFWEEPLPILKTIAAKRVTVRPPERQPGGIAAVHK
jgi:predicted peptidase